MAQPNPQIFGAGQAGRSLANSAQRRVNCFGHIVRDPNKVDRAAISFWCRPGLGAGFSRTGPGGGAAYYGPAPVRGKFQVGLIVYEVRGNTLYQLLADGTETALGALLSNAGPVYIIGNGAQVGLCDGLGNWYVYQISGVSAATGLPAGSFQTFVPGAGGFLGAIHCTYQNNAAVVVVPGTNPLTSQQMQQGNLGDFTGWNALAFNLADDQPDPLLAVKGYKGIVYAFGSLSTERWQNLGLSPFQFGRYPGTTLMVGLVATASIAEFGDSGLCILGRSVSGQAVPTFISQGGLGADNDNPMADADMVAQINAKNADGSLVYGSLADAVGETFMWDSHRFYLLSFPTAQKTWLWDGETGWWSELTSDAGAAAGGNGIGIPTGVQGQFRGLYALVFNERLLFTDFYDGHIYQANATGVQDTDNGCVFPMQLVSQHIFQLGKMIGLPRLELDLEAGVGNLSGAGTDPQAQIEMSRDKGATWSVPLFAAIGKTGKRSWRTIFRRMGSGRDLTLRLTLSDPVKRVLTGETPEIEIWAA